VFTLLVHQERLQMVRGNEEAWKRRLGAIDDDHLTIQNLKRDSLHNFCFLGVLPPQS